MRIKLNDLWGTEMENFHPDDELHNSYCNSNKFLVPSILSVMVIALYKCHVVSQKHLNYLIYASYYVT